MTIRFEPRPIDTALRPLFARPPAYARLEPQSVSGDPRPGLAGAVHDPLWALLRQWQFGEFAGEDAGQPLSAALTWDSAPIEGYAPGPAVAGARGRTLAEGELLDPVVEAIGQAGPPDLRARADAGGLLVAMLADAGQAAGPALAAAHPFAADEIATAPAWLRIVLRGKPDGAAAAAALRAGTPAWLAALPAAAQDAAKAWLDWYGRAVQPAPDDGGWHRAGLEYRFSIGTKDKAGTRRTFAATEHLGGTIDWWSLDEVPGAALALPGRRTMAVPRRSRAPLDLLGRPFAIMPVKLVQPLRFAGMAADRLWEFEDATVNYGAMDVQVNDPARLCLIEFASVYGADWFQIPLDVDPAALTTINSLTVRDTFGETFAIPPATDRAGRFRLYETSIAGTADDATGRGLLTLPTAALTLEGPATETVHFVRDEMANMVWAIEERVAGADGRGRRRADERRAPTVPLPPLMAGAELRYTLESEVPAYWIPFVPVPDGAGGFRLRKGSMTGADASASRLLAGRPVDIADGEVPADGLRVERVPQLARAADGSLLRWTAYRIRPGTGPGASGLAFDAATDDPRPTG
ncbi:MAG: hypothetical protein PGN09_09585 [Sphingomonas fennica]